MAQFQTWFGSASYLAYGIQLIPLTPVAEHRDTLNWSKEMYHTFAESCSSDPGCTTDGWSIIQLALLATVGHQKQGADIAIALPADVFESAGGNGHSLTNTIWYYATRPIVDKPLPLTKAEAAAQDHAKPNKTDVNVTQVSDCGRPGTCTDYILDTIAGEYTCRQRMDWLVQQMGDTEKSACSQIAGVENAYECGACDPEGHDNDKKPMCSQCTHKQCQRYLNLCPRFDSTFVCTDGGSAGGCSGAPWNVPTTQCRECCELTRCSEPSAAEERARNEANCPRCQRKECRSGAASLCAPYEYVCLDGLNKGGCSQLPWAVKGAECSKCCKKFPGCDK